MREVFADMRRESARARRDEGAHEVWDQQLEDMEASLRRLQQLGSRRPNASVSRIEELAREVEGLREDVQRVVGDEANMHLFAVVNTRIPHLTRPALLFRAVEDPRFQAELDEMRAALRD
jgi:hypothetical protein